MDLDAQGNASTGLGVPKDEREKSTYDLLTGKAVSYTHLRAHET